MKFFDLFAGIGGFRIALEREGFTCVGFCEIDKWARKLYKAYYSVKEEEEEYEDATKINPEDLPDFDILCAGFPCQAFSIAGKRRGFKDTRGTLFFEIARIAKVKRPTYLLLENVKGLLSHDEGRTFEIILKTLDELGYDAEWQVLNSKDFGVPQNRERVFIIGHLRGKSRPKIFPLSERDRIYYQPPKVKEKICKDIQSGGEIAATLMARQYANWNGNYVIDKPIRVGLINKGGQGERVYSSEGIAVTLKANGGGRGAKTGLYLTNDSRIRRLTPLECFRLQGFPDSLYYKAKELGISDSQLYRMAGNAVTVQVVQSIAKKLMQLKSIKSTCLKEAKNDFLHINRGEKSWSFCSQGKKGV